MATEEEFMERAIKFSNKIDDYSILLGLDLVKVAAFKSDCGLLTFALKNRAHLQMSGAHDKPQSLDVMIGSFLDLVNACKQSANYSNLIGLELGMEPPFVYVHNEQAEPQKRGKN